MFMSRVLTLDIHWFNERFAFVVATPNLAFNTCLSVQINKVYLLMLAICSSMCFLNYVLLAPKFQILCIIFIAFVYAKLFKFAFK